MRKFNFYAAKTKYGVWTMVTEGFRHHDFIEIKQFSILFDDNFLESVEHGKQIDLSRFLIDKTSCAKA